MIVVLATYDMAPEDRFEFIESREEQVKRTQTEAGCLEYRFCFDAFEPGRITLIERWQTMADLQRHVKVVEEFRASLPPETISYTRTVLLLDGEPIER
ncbi:MAG TPA: antibiotic biosynthesis monooxygenase family protein [Mycobacteriales bacterium]|nr:antibiotic biosynthesis monooxygenase family protein [Mycobacteriales bacterium]